ncbi:FecCD family ABC transporter permease [Pseudonocardia sp. CA-107938]|uniref:FecCD family ABC transporter permease n=1 Tax=Pseudonocardia sp. CA-107938 TaxID=3240021 RepID=UPI003D940B60
MRGAGALVGLALVGGILFVLAVAPGPVPVPLADTVRVIVGAEPSDPRWSVVIGTFRLARAGTAVLAGAGLGVAGLLMQTLFRNALADPYVLGVSAGASLGVALFLAATTTAAAGATFGASLVGLGRVGAVGAAAVGAAGVLGLVLVLARRVRSAVTLLIVGVMVGAVAAAVVSLVLVWSDPLTAQQYLVWGLGSVDATTGADLPVLAAVVAAGLVLAGLVAAPLTAFLLGEDYARSMGVDVRLVRIAVLVAAALLAGGITAYCGPIAFVGIAVPHLARLVAGTSDHRLLLPATALVGAVTLLACTIAAHPPGAELVVPLNVVTSLIGGPVVIAVLLRSSRFAGAAT